jgi:hypothetical protein
MVSKKKTHEEYMVELTIKNPAIEVVGRYIDANTKILHHCLIHNVYWETTPSRALQGVGCEMCKKERFHKTKCKTHEQYVNEVSVVNPNIEVIGKYIDATTSIEHYCKKHCVLWNCLPDNILHGHGCKECGNEKIGDKFRKTHEQYTKEVKAINQDIIVIGQYVGANIPILHKCKVDGYEWNAAPASILYGSGCPKCGGTLKRTHEEYVKDVSLINPDIEVIGEYVNATTPVLHKCKMDGYEWLTTPCVILMGCGCPQCNESHGERLVRQWLKNNDIQYISQKKFDDCKDAYPLPFDFYLPDYNCCIEYDGKQHYESVVWFGGQKSLEYIQKHDEIKTEYCKNNNIKLLRIPYFKNVEETLNNFLFI